MIKCEYGEMTCVGKTSTIFAELTTLLFGIINERILTEEQVKDCLEKATNPEDMKDFPNLTKEEVKKLFELADMLEEIDKMFKKKGD